MSYSSPNSKKVDPAAKQLEQQIKLLEAIIKKPGNDNCADCGQKGFNILKKNSFFLLTMFE